MHVDRDELAVPALQAAPRLLGAELVSFVAGAEVRVRLTEVEAYEGPDDPASHAFRGPTPRNGVMFGEPGHLYAYFVYGMHWCANVICGPRGTAAGVLLRAGEIVAGLDVARSRTPPGARKPWPDAALGSGPARLARVLGIGAAQVGLDLLDDASEVQLLALGQQTPTTGYRSGPRVGVVGAAERPWRFWIDGHPSVSAYRPAAARIERTSPPGAARGRATRQTDHRDREV